MRTINNFWRIAFICFLVIGLALQITASAQAIPQAEPVIYKVLIDTVNDGSFRISWTTDIASDGSVTWGASTPPTNLVTDPVVNSTTHAVIISGLNQSTPYFFKVKSGNTEDTNGGVFYSINTAPSIGAATPGNTVYGTVYQSNGTTAVPYAIVYLQLQDANGSGTSDQSQWVSARADASGGYSFNMGNFRTSNLGAYFIFTYGADELRLIGQGGEKGTVGVDPTPFIVTTSATNPHQVNLILTQNPTIVRLVDFKTPAQNNQVLLPVLGLLVIGLAAGFWRVRARAQRQDQ